MGPRPSPTPRMNRPVGSAYPAARKENVVEVYHGVKVADPYRWLEDPDSPETRAWVEAENKITFGYLESIPARAALKDRLRKLWNYEKFGAPSKQGGRYFYSRNSGLQNQAVLYTTRGPRSGAESPARPQHALRRRDRGPLGDVGQRRRLLDRLRDRLGRVRLERVEGPRCRHRQGPRRPAQVDQVLRSVLDQGRQGLLLRTVSRA